MGEQRCDEYFNPADLVRGSIIPRKRMTVDRVSLVPMPTKKFQDSRVLLVPFLFRPGLGPYGRVGISGPRLPRSSLPRRGKGLFQVQDSRNKVRETIEEK